MSNSLMFPFSYRFLVVFNGRKGSVDTETYKQDIRKQLLVARNLELLDKLHKESDAESHALLYESLIEGTKEVMMINRVIEANIVYSRD